MRRSTALTALVAMLVSLLLLGAAPAQHAGIELTRVIVTFDDDVLPAPAAAALERRFRGDLAYVYEHVLNGAAIDVPARSVDALSSSPGVRRVEPDGVVTTMQTTQSGATWGLDRIDQRALPLDDEYTYNADGTGVTAYVIDTGIRATHNDFGNRVVPGFDAIDGGDGMTDCNGHGTHVASTLGGTTYGVAKDVTLVPVRVLDCSGSGSLSGVIEGIEWVANIAQGRAVANMSLGGGVSPSLDEAVEALISSGVTTIVAAGNDSSDASGFSPARVASAITVGATDSTDQVANFSNQGATVDIFAPGVGVRAAYSGPTGRYKDHTTATLSGTSMAAPHVAGVVALWLENAGPTSGPCDPTSQASSCPVLDLATDPAGLGGLWQTSDNPSDSPDLLLYSLLEESGTGGGGNETNPDETADPDVAISISSPSPGDTITTSTTPTVVTVDLVEVGGADAGIFEVSLEITDSTSDLVTTTLGAEANRAIEFEWATEGLEAGVFTITARHTHDNPEIDGAPSSASVTLEIMAQDGGGDSEAVPHVKSLDVSARSTGPWNRAEAVVTVTDGSANGALPLVGAVVEGVWNQTEHPPGIAATCTTDEVGVCTLSYQQRNGPAAESLVIEKVNEQDPTPDGGLTWTKPEE